MNLGVRVSGFRAVMRLPSPSEISEETHMHRRMTLERMMLDSFVLTGGFELPCFRLRAERTHLHTALCVCGLTYEQAWISSTDVQDPWYMPDLHTAEAQCWCPLGLFDEKMRKKNKGWNGRQKAFPSISLQSAALQLDPDYLSWPRQPCQMTLKSLPSASNHPCFIMPTGTELPLSCIFPSTLSFSSAPASPAPGYRPNWHLLVPQRPACDTQGQILDHTHTSGVTNTFFNSLSFLVSSYFLLLKKKHNLE